MLCIICVSCSKTAKITLVDEKGKTVSFSDEITNLNGKKLGDKIPVTLIKRGNKVSYAAPFNILILAKKGKKIDNETTFEGQIDLTIQSIKFD